MPTPTPAQTLPPSYPDTLTPPQTCSKAWLKPMDPAAAAAASWPVVAASARRLGAHTASGPAAAAHARIAGTHRCHSLPAQLPSTCRCTCIMPHMHHAAHASRITCITQHMQHASSWIVASRTASRVVLQKGVSASGGQCDPRLAAAGRADQCAPARPPADCRVAAAEKLHPPRLCIRPASSNLGVFGGCSQGMRAHARREGVRLHVCASAASKHQTAIQGRTERGAQARGEGASLF